MRYVWRCRQMGRTMLWCWGELNILALLCSVRLTDWGWWPDNLPQHQMGTFWKHKFLSAVIGVWYPICLAAVRNPSAHLHWSPSEMLVLATAYKASRESEGNGYYFWKVFHKLCNEAIVKISKLILLRLVPISFILTCSSCRCLRQMDLRHLAASPVPHDVLPSTIMCYAFP